MIGYLFFRLFTAIFSILPFGAVYKVSDFLAWVLYKVVKYRRKVVEQQLQMCFPEKSSQELQVIAKRSYKNLSDIIVESIKGFSMSKEVLMDRYRFVNPEIATKYTDRGQCVIQVAAHYGNWEWGVISYALWFRSPSMGFYKPLSNKYTDKYAEGK
jgi:Kdo2-lipid IVA lauroyltransferase/acyltransferase